MIKLWCCYDNMFLYILQNVGTVWCPYLITSSFLCLHQSSRFFSIGVWFITVWWIDGLKSVSWKEKDSDICIESFYDYCKSMFMIDHALLVSYTIINLWDLPLFCLYSFFKSFNDTPPSSSSSPSSRYLAFRPRCRLLSFILRLVLSLRMEARNFSSSFCNFWQFSTWESKILYICIGMIHCFYYHSDVRTSLEFKQALHIWMHT